MPAKPPAADAALLALVRAIADGDKPLATRLLSASPSLARAHAVAGASRATAKDYYFDAIAHYLVAGDTALHLAAAAYARVIAHGLLEKGADVRAKNRRGAEPLHYAADGVPGSAHWNPRAQAATVACLLDAGADPNASDNDGVAPLHRAVRTRSASAVRELLAHGADPRKKSGRGSTPMQLALKPTGRGGSGSPEAKAEQQAIVTLLREHGAS